MRSLFEDEGGYSKETGEQVSRLSSLGIFAVADSGCCPLCDQPNSDRIPTTQQLQSELGRASSQLENVKKHTPRLEELIIAQEAKLSDTRRLLKEQRTVMEALRSSDDRLAELRDMASRQAFVLGRISLFRETLPQTEDNSELRQEIEQLQGEMSRLEGELSDEKLQERLDSILSILGKKLTIWAERLEHEHSGNSFRLDSRRLQLVADAETEVRPIPMDRMGSGANALCCHIIAHLALHMWFLRKGRPVPRFLFLDQPSQVYFPAEQDIDGSLAVLDDEDRVAVIRIFELIRDVVAELTPGLQIIITEHADITEDWYQATVVERWRNGTALIPAEWN